MWKGRIGDARALAKEAIGSPEDQQAKEDQDQGAIQALFSFTSSRACAVLETTFWWIKPGHDWMSRTFLHSLTYLILQGQNHFRLCVIHFPGEDHFLTYRRFGSRKSAFLFYLVSTDLRLIFSFGLIINILK